MEPHTAERASIFEVKRDGCGFSTRTLKARSDGPANTRLTLLSVHADPRRNSQTCKCVQSKQARSCTFIRRAHTYKRSGCSFEVRLCGIPAGITEEFSTQRGAERHTEATNKLICVDYSPEQRRRRVELTSGRFS